MNFLRQIGRVLTRNDKIVLGVCFAGLLIGIAGLQKNNSAQFSPAPGGSIKLGIVAENQARIDADLETLTRASLLRFNDQGNIEGSLAKKWEIKDDGKTYSFEIRDGYSAKDAANVLKDQASGLAHVEINAPDDKNLELKLKQPFAPILADLTKPLFPVGFYEVTKKNSASINLKKRPTPLGEAYIDNITVDLFTSQKSLEDALNQQRIDGALAMGDFPANYQKFFLELPRHQVAFLNLTKPIFADKKTRQDLNTQAGLQGLSFTLTTVESGSLMQAGQKFVDNIKNRGGEASLKIVSQQELEDEIIPKRDFDALLITVDFGRDPDSYSFWHSSQIEKGQNLSSFIHKRADRILEDARLTTDETKRKGLYDELDKILKDEVPAVFINQEKIQYNISTRVRGVQMSKGSTPADRFQNVKDWHVRTKKISK